ncbi:MAG: branched-chain amino acid ABC transporter permease [Desulfobacteraceae bacterium]|nr:MAG: branched-chain amino acid ABC transporter permease [Desulfobacteraceae bacterium]
MTDSKRKIFLWLILLCTLIGLPKGLGPYYTNIFLTFAIFATYAVALNLLLGFTGLLSFGHAAYFGFGAYGTALALIHLKGISLLVAIGIGALSSTVLALLLSPIVVRVGGAAFAMVHLAIGQVLYVLALKLANITGGEDGLGSFLNSPMKIIGPFSVDMRPASVDFYYFAMVVIVCSIWLMWFFTKTPFGQVQIAMRDNKKRVSFLGYRVQHSKAVIYLASAFFSGIAGSLLAIFHNLVSAGGAFGIMVNFLPIIAILIGGSAHFFGPVLGAAVFQVLEQMTAQYTSKVELVIGLVLVSIVLFAPSGILGSIEIFKARRSKRRFLALNRSE